MAKNINAFLIIGSYLFFSGHCMASNHACVILLHGLGRTHHSMSNLASILEKHDYIVVNHHYPSTKKSVDELATESIPGMIDECLSQPVKHIHFVTHSLGGIILQQYLQAHTVRKLKYIVMLGPPNHGSPLIDILNRYALVKFLLGPAATTLTTKRSDVLLAHDQYKIGIIAGNYNLNPLENFIFGEPNDGKVSVSSTQMQQMYDFILLPVSHTFMMNNALVQDQIIYFLTYGHFRHKTGKSSHMPLAPEPQFHSD
jgi:triacylglycerol lipase